MDERVSGECYLPQVSVFPLCLIFVVLSVGLCPCQHGVSIGVVHEQIYTSEWVDADAEESSDVPGESSWHLSCLNLILNLH